MTFEYCCHLTYTPSWRILDLDQPGLGMAREYLMKGLEDPDVQAYQEYMQDVALLLGADKDTVINDIKETIKFEIELAKISLPRSFPTDKKLPEFKMSH